MEQRLVRWIASLLLQNLNFDHRHVENQVCFKVKVCLSCCQLLVACKDTLKIIEAFPNANSCEDTCDAYLNMIKHVHMRGFSDPNLQSLPPSSGGSSKARDQGRALSGDTEIRVATDAITTSNFLPIPCGKCTETLAFHGCMSMTVHAHGIYKFTNVHVWVISSLFVHFMFNVQPANGRKSTEVCTVCHHAGGYGIPMAALQQISHPIWLVVHGRNGRNQALVTPHLAQLVVGSSYVVDEGQLWSTHLRGPWCSHEMPRVPLADGEAVLAVPSLH